jgi:mevalonate kinase
MEVGNEFSGRYGIHPKMTGAGGGGCLYAFLKPGINSSTKWYKT